MNYLDQVNKIIKLSNLTNIIEILSLDKKDIYFVGGVARSILNDKYDNKDIDLVIPNLQDSSIEKLDIRFKTKYYPNYKSLAISYNDYDYQINSFRKDIHSTGRHTKVAEAKSLQEDSKRRDFTFNSVYINLLGEVFDFYDGVSHFNDSYLKFIFDPIEQIQKDYLRAIRYIRFLSLFKITKTNTVDVDAIILLSKNITEFVKGNKISKELKKSHNMYYPENTLSFLKKHKELNVFLDYL